MCMRMRLGREDMIRYGFSPTGSEGFYLRIEHGVA